MGQLLMRRLQCPVEGLTLGGGEEPGLDLEELLQLAGDVQSGTLPLAVQEVADLAVGDAGPRADLVEGVHLPVGLAAGLPQEDQAVLEGVLHLLGVLAGVIEQRLHAGDREARAVREVVEVDDVAPEFQVPEKLVDRCDDGLQTIRRVHVWGIHGDGRSPGRWADGTAALAAVLRLTVVSTVRHERHHNCVRGPVPCPVALPPTLTN